MKGTIASVELNDIIKALISPVEPKGNTELKEVIKNVTKKSKITNQYPVYHANMPFNNCVFTEEMKVIRRLVKGTSLE